MNPNTKQYQVKRAVLYSSHHTPMKHIVLTFLAIWGVVLFLLLLVVVGVRIFGQPRVASHLPEQHVTPTPTPESVPVETTHESSLPTVTARYGTTTQFIAISFDGSRSNALWAETLAFADALRASGTPISFTYFISGVYLIPHEQKNLYHLSWLTPRESAIPYGDSQSETDKRISYINQAYADGHAIGSHLNGHFDGSAWTEAQWCEELQTFDDILYDHMSEPLHRSVAFAVPRADLIGIRTPSLSHNDALFTCLAQHGYQYDASLIGKIGAEPSLLPSQILEFPLVSIPFRKGSVLSMDYNMYFLQTKAVDVIKKGTPEWDHAKAEVYDAYMKYFEREYNGARAPMNIGNHFSAWNGGVYLSALEDFAHEVCGKPDVACVNYNTLNKEMRARMVPTTE